MRFGIYIDGLNLSGCIKNHHRQHGWPNYQWVNPEELCSRVIGGRLGRFSQADFISYYSTEYRIPEDMRSQKEYWKALSSLPNFAEVDEGRFSHRHHKARVKNRVLIKIKTEWWEEKETDVNLACDIVRDAYKNRFDTAILIAEDTDYKRPVKILQDEFPKEKTLRVLHFDKIPAANSLARYANGSEIFRITKSILRNSQFPQTVQWKDDKGNPCTATNPYYSWREGARLPLGLSTLSRIWRNCYTLPLRMRGKEAIRGQKGPKG